MQNKERVLVTLGVVGLLAALVLQLSLSVSRDSPTWDEGDHIFAGYRSLTNKDFGLNPEHPPVVKMLAAAPLLSMPLKVPEVRNRFFMHEAFLDGKEFLFANDADAMMFRARMTASILTVLLALLVFLATREFFGTGSAFIALTLIVFEPNLLAHGARVTTDAGLSCFMFATIYAFYRYVKIPSAWRLAVVGLATGLTLAAKHTGILVIPMLALLAICEVLRVRLAKQHYSEGSRGTGRHAGLLAVSLITSLVIGVGVLWASYGFRFAARPYGLQLNPGFAEWVGQLKPVEAHLLSFAARWHLLPESYLYGLAAVRLSAETYTTFVFGTIYPHGVWFYFPVAFVIKSTLAFLVLLGISVFAIASRKLTGAREILFLTIPPAFYLIVAMNSKINIGVRHILPLYVFFSVLIGGAAWSLVRRDRRWRYVVAALLLFHVFSSVRSYPNYMAYSNELWGGPSQTYKYLTDSNVDWAQQLKSTKQYLDGRGIKECWFAYFGQGVLEPHYYGIPSKPLPTADSLWMNEQIDVPPTIDGTVLVSGGVLSGFEFGPGALNPYRQFQQLRPVAVIDDGVFVFEGHFEIPLASALGHAQHAMVLLEGKQLNEALVEAQAAVALAPDSVTTQSALGDALTALNRQDEARPVYQRALELARTVEPEFQVSWIPTLEAKLASK
ncbi:MAG TPA: glycosyltransferase family 39 protein [Pyrinomonadaceae bacterium]|nr:glycosyltransferase family 39 protein [Pyrinomonadaceae bacterium]